MSDPDTRQHLFSALEALYNDNATGLKDFFNDGNKTNYIDSGANSPNVALIQPQLNKILQGDNESARTWALGLDHRTGSRDKNLKLFWTEKDINTMNAGVDHVKTLCYDLMTKKYSVTDMEVQKGWVSKYGDYNVIRYNSTVDGKTYDTYEEALASYKAL